MKKSNRNTSTSNRHRDPIVDCVSKYFETQSKVFHSSFTSARSYYAVEGIHELRVSIKKLRSLYKLINYMSPSFVVKPNASALKQLFKTAGKLRDIDRHQAITLKHLKSHDVSEYFNLLKQDELRLRGRFAEVTKLYGDLSLSKTRAMIRSSLISTPGDRTRKRMAKKILRLTGKLTDVMGKNRPGTNDLHSVRKGSKTLRYALDVWEQCSGQTPGSVAASVQLKKAYSLLGDWRDVQLTLESVDTFLKENTGKKLFDAMAYESLRDSLLKRADNLLVTFGRTKKPLKRSLDRLSNAIRVASGN